MIDEKWGAVAPRPCFHPAFPVPDFMISFVRETNMELFKLRTNLVTYRSPVIRCFASIFVLFLIFYRNQYIQTKSHLIEGILMIVCLVLTLLSILCIYISIAEIFYVFKNRHSEKMQKIGKTKTVPSARRRRKK